MRKEQEESGEDLVIHCSLPSELDDFAGAILERIGNAKVVAFYGQLGAGKTTLIKSLCRKMGVVDVVTSPTFALVNEYRLMDSGLIYHFDFYRIHRLVEVLDLGYEEYFFSGHFCFIEWPELIETLLPRDVTRLNILVREDGSRVVIVSNRIIDPADEGP